MPGNTFFLRLLLLIGFSLRTNHGCTQVKLTVPNGSLLVWPIWVGALQIKTIEPFHPYKAIFSQIIIDFTDDT